VLLQGIGVRQRRIKFFITYSAIVDIVWIVSWSIALPVDIWDLEDMVIKITAKCEWIVTWQGWVLTFSWGSTPECPWVVACTKEGRLRGGDVVVKPPMRYECLIVDIVVQYWLLAAVICDCVVVWATPASVLCIRVLTMSIGNIGNQPTTPATPPPTNNTHRGKDSTWIGSNSKLESCSSEERGVRYRHVALYFATTSTRENRLWEHLPPRNMPHIQTHEGL